MPRTVVLRHDHPDSSHHFDWLFEPGGTGPADPDARVLITFRLATPPHTALGETLAATRLPPHRRLYLDYEGPLTGERGTVRCCDRGELELLEEGKHGLTALLSGDLLRGKIRLTRLGQEWSLETV